MIVSDKMSPQLHTMIQLLGLRSGMMSSECEPRAYVQLLILEGKAMKAHEIHQNISD